MELPYGGNGGFLLAYQVTEARNKRIVQFVEIIKLYRQITDRLFSLNYYG